MSSQGCSIRDEAPFATSTTTTHCAATPSLGRRDVGATCFLGAFCICDVVVSSTGAITVQDDSTYQCVLSGICSPSPWNYHTKYSIALRDAKDSALRRLYSLTLFDCHSSLFVSFSQFILFYSWHAFVTLTASNPEEQN